MSENNYLDISNYVFQKDIGEGNFGKVKLGIFKPTGEEFAIKILNKNKIKIKMKNSIFKENEIITRFNHINVVYVFHILEDVQNYYIIMEYCKHGELFDYIVKKEKLSEEESSIFFYQLINGIEYIHSKGISHRDLKPENLLLAENNILKIIDFGLSHEFEGDELLKTKCGSPSYAAPEIICCPFYDGFKVDIWCSGIILYAMLCGYLPFEGDNNSLLFQNILNCDPEFPEFLSDLSKDIIIQILNPDPDARITIDEIKKHKFYLKGKKLCNIDYENIENCVIKKRNTFTKNNIKIIKNNIKIKNFETEKKNENKTESNNISEKNNKNKTEKYMHNINKNDNIEKIKGNVNEEDLIYSKENINTDNMIKDSLKETKIESSSSSKFKKQIMEINSKYNNRIDTINNKIQQILKTDINDNLKISLRPFSSQQKFNTNKNIVSLSNNSNSNLNSNNNSKPYNQSPYFNLISENKENYNHKKNSLFLKLLDSAKNKYFNIYKTNDKFDSIKSNSKRINFNLLNEEKSKKSTDQKKAKEAHSFFTNFKTNCQKININAIDNNTNYNQNHLISLSNDNLYAIEKQIQTCKNKKSQKFNLFKKSIKPEKNKGKHYFNIKKALSKHDTNIERNRNKDYRRSINNSKKSSKSKQLNLYVPNSTLYYNNININIKEVNINSKETRNQKNNIISSIINTQRMKNPSQPKRGNSYRHYNKNNRIENKALSAKRLITYNINTNNINNLKTNINTMNHTTKTSKKNININKAKSKNHLNGNLYTISNSNRHPFMNTMYNNDINFNYNYYYNTNNNIKKAQKYKNIDNNLYGFSKNIKFANSEKNINIFKNEKILSTEPKIISKRFNTNRQSRVKQSNKIRLHSEMNNEYKKDIKRRSKTEKMMKSRTINTEVDVNLNNNYKKNWKYEGNVNDDILKKIGNKHNKKNIDEMLLHIFLKQKHNTKNYNQNSFRK